MATPSSLISKIHSVLQSPATDYVRYSLKIGLRNLNMILICLRNLGDIDDTELMKSLFSRIEDAIGGERPISWEREREIHCLAREAHDVWYRYNNAAPFVVPNELGYLQMEGGSMSNCLTLYDALEVGGSIVRNTTDFWDLAVRHKYWIRNPANLQYVMEEFEVQARFLRDFLLFASQTGVQSQQMQKLLILICPFVRDSARMFQIDGPLFFSDGKWIEQVQSKCPELDPQVFEAYAQTLLSISTVDNGFWKDFLGSLISLLWHILRYRRHPQSLKPLYEVLRLSRFILKQQQPNSNGDFENQIGVLIRDAGILICSLYLTDIDEPYLSDLLQRFDVVRALVPLESNSLKENALDFGDYTSMEEISDGRVEIEAAMPSHQSSSTSKEVGFQEDEVASVLDRLTRGSKQLRLVPITGMAGLGKTTFALKVYNHHDFTYHFQARAWCSISQMFDKGRVLLQLLSQIQPGDYSEMTEDDLANKLRQSLSQKRYLILLDDVWTPQVLESLRLSFPNDETQSRIVLTSRLHAIVPHALLDEQPHFLRLRKESECLEIIEMKLLHKVGWSTILGEFAKLCKGLPLTAVIVAGLLATTVQEGWVGILDHLSSGGISGMEQCKIALELSYKHLPDDLKLCFVYFGAFPEDEEIQAEKLTRLWMAEGFVAQKKDLLKKRIEDVARGYLDDLIQRNLVMVAKKRSTGGVKTCRIHDLLHDFCLMKGKEENLFHVLLKRHDELSNFNEPCNLERLSIHSTALHFKESRLFCPLAHSMLFFSTTGGGANAILPDMLFIIQTSKLLKVLNVDGIWFITGIPSEIALLTQLTYLSIRCYSLVIPSSIGKLSNLETLIIRGSATHATSLPHTIWYLQKLKYLFIRNPGFSLPIENLEKSPNLLELEVICGVTFYSNGSMEKQMKKFPNIRRLKCNILRGGGSSKELNKMIVVPEYLSKLEMLTLRAESRLQYEFDFGSTAGNLRKVTLEMLVLSREEIAVIGKLPNLEVLKLRGIEFLEGKMEMEEGKFSKLRILVLHESSSVGITRLETWTADGEEQLPCLEKLVFNFCKNLKEIPSSCLETSPVLEEIEAYGCSSALESLVRSIEEVQKDFGNLIKVLIHSRISGI